MDGWWRRDPFFMRYMAREVTALFVAAYAVCCWSAWCACSPGRGGVERLAAALKTPVSHRCSTCVLLAMFVYHTWSWFKIMPKTMPMMLRRRQARAAGARSPAPAAPPPWSRALVVLLHRAGGAVMKRSNAPIFWPLFGAGGMLAALIGPALVFITGIAVPMGWPVRRDTDELRAHAGVCAELGRQGVPVRRHRAVRRGTPRTASSTACTMSASTPARWPSCSATAARWPAR